MIRHGSIICYKKSNLVTGHPEAADFFLAVGQRWVLRASRRCPDGMAHVLAPFPVSMTFSLSVVRVDCCCIAENATGFVLSSARNVDA